MYIPKWISGNVLNFECSNSRAYISNAITHETFWLKEESSDLWKIIIDAKNIEEVYEYAKKKNLGDELPEFISMLEKNGLLIKKNNSDIIKSKISNHFSSLKTQDDFSKQWTQENIKENKLTRIQLDVTYKCNEKCIHCLNDKSMDEIEINFNQAKSLIDDAYDLGLTQIVLTGGECTLINDFLKIAQYVREKRIELIIFTNGQKLYNDDSFFNEVVNLYPYYIGLSLYSMREEIHEKITQIKGSYKKTLKVIEKLSEHNVPIEIKCFLTKYNANDYQEVIQFAKNNNYMFGIDDSLVPNKDNSNLYTKITKEQQESLYKYLYKNKMAKFSTTINDEFLNEFPCISGRTTLDIDPRLNIRSCPTSSYIFGNLNNISLKELWDNNNPNSPIKKWSTIIRKDFKDCFDKDYCKYCNFCPGKYTNEYQKRNLLCENAKLRMKIVQNYENRL